jgi:hypothetical protein
MPSCERQGACVISQCALATAAVAAMLIVIHSVSRNLREMCGRVVHHRHNIYFEVRRITSLFRAWLRNRADCIMRPFLRKPLVGCYALPLPPAMRVAFNNDVSLLTNDRRPLFVKFASIETLLAPATTGPCQAPVPVPVVLTGLAMRAYPFNSRVLRAYAITDRPTRNV